MNEVCEVCGLPFRSTERRSLFGTHHDLTTVCVRRLREENARQRTVAVPILGTLDASTRIPRP